jgi:hypothetical protein
MGDKRYELLASLLRATKNGKVRWQATVNEDQFLAAFPDSSLTVAAVPPGSHYPGVRYRVEISDSHGRVMDAFADSEGVAGASQSGPYVDTRSFGAVMEDLFLEARRSALQPEKVVESLLERLKALA